MHNHVSFHIEILYIENMYFGESIWTLGAYEPDVNVYHEIYHLELIFCHEISKGFDNSYNKWIRIPMCMMRWRSGYDGVEDGHQSRVLHLDKHINISTSRIFATLHKWSCFKNNHLLWEPQNSIISYYLWPLLQAMCTLYHVPLWFMNSGKVATWDLLLKLQENLSIKVFHTIICWKEWWWW